MKSILKIQIKILLSLTIIVTGASLLIWLHPTLGHAPKDSIISGADLRSDIIQILWIAFFILGLSSSIILKMLVKFTSHWSIWLISYASSLGLLILIFPWIDRYY